MRDADKALAFAMLAVLAGALSSCSIVAYRLTDNLEPTAKAILLGAMAMGVILGFPLMAMILYAVRSREADKAEFLAAMARMNPPKQPDIRVEPTYHVPPSWQAPKDFPTFYGRGDLEPVQFLAVDEEE